MMEIARLLAGSLRNRVVVWVAGLFFFSACGIRMVKVLLLPVEVVRCMRSWPQVIKYKKILLPEQNAIRSLLRYHLAQADQAVWSSLVHNAWDQILRYNDFSSVDDLRNIAGRGKGMLLLGMHYGALFGGYLLYRKGLKPVMLAEQANIPDLERIPFKRLLTNEYIFRGTYDGIIKARHGEKRFVEMMLTDRPGIIMMDEMGRTTNFLLANCLGIDYPIGVFPFKLALTRAFPVVIIWFSKIKGKGYKLNVREITFSTIEEGMAQYAALLDRIVRADPFLWYYGPTYAKYRYRVAGQVVD